MAKNTEIIGTFLNGVFVPVETSRLDAEELEGKMAVFTFKTADKKKLRSGQERKAIEVWCAQVSDKFNEGGIGMVAIISKFNSSADLPASQQGIKETIFKQMMWYCFNVESTTELQPTQPHHVWQWCDAFTQKHFNFSVPWPDKKEDERQ